MATLRLATLADIPRLSELLTLLFTQEADFQPDDARQRAGLRRIIENPDIGRILLAQDGAEVAGMVNLLFTVSTALGGRVALLEDMVVDPRVRARGIGAALLRGAVDLARQTGCLRITLLTDRSNEGAIRFYQRHGFGPSAMVPLRLPLT